MNKAEAKMVIRLRFQKLEKLYRPMKKTMDMDIIHQFRVEIKKLRAILRTLPVHGSGKEIKIPGKLEKIYRHAGDVRNLQNHIHAFENFNTGKDKPPSVYTTWINKRLGLAQKELRKLMLPGILKDARQKINHQLPEQVSDSDIEKIIFVKSVASGNIPATKTIADEPLHTIRKELKDIIFTAKIFSVDLERPHPCKGWDADLEKHCSAVAEELGRFQDLCTYLEQLNEQPADPFPKPILAWIGKYRRNLQARKNKMKKILLEMIPVLAIDLEKLRLS